MSTDLCPQRGAPGEIGRLFCKNCGATLQVPAALIQSKEQTATSKTGTTIEQKVQTEMILKSCASWLLSIAVLSLVNTVLYLFGIPIEFLFRLWGGLGLAVTELVSVLALRSGGFALILALIINGFIAGVFIVLWSFARKAKSWAFWAGAGLYALDGLFILVSWQRPVGVLIFHGLAVLLILRGAGASSTLQKLEQPS